MGRCLTLDAAAPSAADDGPPSQERLSEVAGVRPAQESEAAGEGEPYRASGRTAGRCYRRCNEAPSRRMRTMRNTSPVRPGPYSPSYLESVNR